MDRHSAQAKAKARRLQKAGMFRYSVTAAAFFQANDLMTEQLAEIVRSCTTGSGSGLALDLFAGVGLVTIPLAAEFSRVVAVESAPEASRLCAINSAGAGMNNIDPICADVLQYLESGEISPLPDLVVLDPPRTGAGGGDATDQRARRERSYVSCDPQTLARDLSVVSAREQNRHGRGARYVSPDLPLRNGRAADRRQLTDAATGQTRGRMQFPTESVTQAARGRRFLVCTRNSRVAHGR